MKRKIQLTKGLSINKEAVAKLQESQMTQLRGGINGSSNSLKTDTCKSCLNQSCNYDDGEITIKEV
ncbi:MULTISPECIES: class I lanthipeptide [Elizabethkingia]|uniref:class I lanthipeptide n=1 Tax=Elizabethkingia TaxID=308865 RepID=UPI000463735A|nr:class I lanthipeptide [Elizabethkingia anophelis]MDC8028245.1 class I lanthipeptide [Elizabethkingia anophelis]MDV3898817.1 hypothetical protein [Elizabethkingia anophelis]MDV4036817.1 hypothetical protein [Elizabethkingia anophelis]